MSSLSPSEFSSFSSFFSLYFSSFFSHLSSFFLDFSFWSYRETASFFCEIKASRALVIQELRFELFMIFLVSFQFSPFSLLIREINRFLILCWFLPGKASEILAHFLGFSTDCCNNVMSSSRVHSFLVFFLNFPYFLKKFTCL